MRLIFRFSRWFLALGFSSLLIGLLSVVAIYIYYAPQLPEIEALKDVQFQVPLKVYTRDQELIAEFGEKRRSPVEYSDIPPVMVQAFLSAEDDRFFEHPGVDYQGILRAVTQLILTGRKTQGGSTITMQVARNFFLTRDKTYERKIKEILLALKIERALNKQEILQLYLNKIYLGKRAYGVGAAAEVYYGKTLADLTLAQVAMIAGLPKAPSRYNPIASPDRAVIRRNYVIKRMLDLAYIDQAESEAALNAPVSARVYAPLVTLHAPHAAEMVRAQMVRVFGDSAYTSGYRVITTLDKEGQTNANKALRNALDNYDRRHGYRGPIVHLENVNDMSPDAMDEVLKGHSSVAELIPGIIIQTDEKSARAYLGHERSVALRWPGIKWARNYEDENTLGERPQKVEDVILTGDVVYVRQDEDDQWRLSQIPRVSGALIAMNPQDGAILSLVGSYDFYHSKFNRALQSKRQPGSGFKPILYSAGLEAGFTLASTINDAPIVFKDATMQDGAWRPENYSSKFFGPTRLRKALYKSRNLVSVRLLDAIGVPAARSMAQRFGFPLEEVPNNLTLALGSGSTVPLRMAATYSVFANGGFRVKPYLIDQVRSVDNELVLKASPEVVCASCLEGIDVNTSAAENTGLLMQLDQYQKASVEHSLFAGPEKTRLAQRILSPQVHYQITSILRDVVKRGTGRKAMQLGRLDLAGKTGTTNEQRDAWFNGFNPELAVTAWVGFDDQTPLGKKETGGRAALPMWMSFMEKALKGKPERTLVQPDGMVTIKIDPETGLALSPGEQGGIFETFRKALAPEVGTGDDSDSFNPTQEQSAANPDVIENLF